MNRARSAVLLLGPPTILLQQTIGALPGRLVYDLVALLPLIVLVFRRRVLEDRVATRLLGASLVLFNLANLVWTYYLAVQGQTPYGSPADLLFALGWLVLLAYAIVLLRQRRGRLGGILDGAVLSTSVGAIVLLLVLAPGLGAGALSPAAQAVGLVNLLLGLMTLGAVLGVLLGRAGRQPALAWGLVAISCAVLATGGVTAIAAGADPRLRGPIDVVLLCAYLCVTVSLLTGRGPNVPAVDGQTERLRTGRLMLTGAALVAPSVVALLRPSPGRADSLLVAASAVVLVTLVLVRLAGLASDRERAEGALVHQASHDPLTGLANRTLLLAHLQTSVAQCRPGSGRVLVLAFLDLNNFKAVNDTFGHAAGDRVLQETAALLTASIREGDLAARQGGDEFLVLCPDLAAGDLAGLSDRLGEACTADVFGVLVSASIGLVTSDDPLAEPEQLLYDADQRMYAHKQRRRAEPWTPGEAQAGAAHQHVPSPRWPVRPPDRLLG